MGRKVIAGICIVAGIALLAVPFFYKLHGKSETDKLLKKFEQTLEEDVYEEETMQKEPERVSKPPVVKRTQPYFLKKMLLASLRLKP